MPYPVLTFEQLATLYCERTESTKQTLYGRLTEQRRTFHPIGWVLLECVQLDSSRLGERVILPYGPSNTLKQVPEHAVSPRGLASDMSIVIGIMPTTNLME